jgi:hypothetical protein
MYSLNSRIGTASKATLRSYKLLIQTQLSFANLVDVFF